VGNSFTYFNNMPAILEAISGSVSGPRVVTTMVASGGARLKDHWQDGGPALSAIRKGGWDYVVLQEQSLLGNVLIVNQHMQIADPAYFWKYAKLFDEEIRKVGAKTVILMSWKDKNDAASLQQALDFAFVKFASSSGAVAAPVSLAWQRIRDNAPGINLYFKDDHHPSPEGSYLEACVLYASLTGRSPVGAISTIQGTAVEEDEGKVLEGKPKPWLNFLMKLQEHSNKLRGTHIKKSGPRVDIKPSTSLLRLLCPHCQMDAAPRRPS